jgi:hypothetical protein
MFMFTAVSSCILLLVFFWRVILNYVLERGGVKGRTGVFHFLVIITKIISSYRSAATPQRAAVTPQHRCWIVYTERDRNIT